MFKVRIPDVVGMDQATLESTYQYMKQVDAADELESKRLQEQMKAIKQEQNAIKKEREKIQKCMQQIEAEQQKSTVAQYENIIEIKKRTTARYVGPEQRRSYYYAGDWKPYKVYCFYVKQVNVLGAEKGSRMISESIQYLASEKSEFMLDVIETMQKYCVNKIYIADDVTVNSNALRKANKNVQIFKQTF